MSSTINNFKIAYESVWLRDFLQDVMNSSMKDVLLLSKNGLELRIKQSMLIFEFNILCLIRILMVLQPERNIDTVVTIAIKKTPS